MCYLHHILCVTLRLTRHKQELLLTRFAFFRCLSLTKPTLRNNTSQDCFQVNICKGYMFVQYHSMVESPAQLLYLMPWSDFQGSSRRVKELALVLHRKVSLPLYQRELQINDQGRRLSAGLHASSPIHRQTCQGAIPPGISGIFMACYHHFCLLPIGCE